VVTRPGLIGQAVRSENWRFSRWGSDDAIELYNLSEDLEEHHNLAHSPEYASIVNGFQQKLRDTRRELKEAAKK
ncbi:MAG: hypothetical protein AAGB06_04165, partial [Verrucomicrobiota bacterium]